MMVMNRFEFGVYVIERSMRFASTMFMGALIVLFTLVHIYWAYGCPIMLFKLCSLGIICSIFIKIWSIVLGLTLPPDLAYDLAYMVFIL